MIINTIFQIIISIEVVLICFLWFRENRKRRLAEIVSELRQANIEMLHDVIAKREEMEEASAELMRAKDERISVLEYELSAKEELMRSKDAEIYVLRAVHESDWNERKKVIAEYARVKNELIDIDKAIDEAVEELEIEDFDLENFDFIKEP